MASDDDEDVYVTDTDEDGIPDFRPASDDEKDHWNNVNGR
jgi:hypothetical protein